MGTILSPTACGEYPQSDVFCLFHMTYGRDAGLLCLRLYQPKGYVCIDFLLTDPEGRFGKPELAGRAGTLLLACSRDCYV